MRKWQRVVLGAALVGVTAGGAAIVTGTANAQSSGSGSSDQSVTETWKGGVPAQVAANERLVQAFMQDVLNEHHGDYAAQYLTSGMSWHGGTVGTVTGRDNVAGLMTLVVISIPDLHAEVQDVFGQDNKVVVRLVVTGTLQGDLLSITGTGQHVQ